MEIGELIRTERQRRGWSQRFLARRLGITHGAISQWENGLTTPDLERIIDICSVFEISAQSFIGPGAPYEGQIVQDAEELELLTLWRRLSPPERQFALKLLGNTRGPSEPDNPQRPRKLQNQG